MSDINFLPSDFKKKEEKEKKRPKPSLSSQMSDPELRTPPKEQKEKQDKDLLGDVIASLKESIAPITDSVGRSGQESKKPSEETDPPQGDPNKLKTDLIHAKGANKGKDVDTAGLSLKSVDDHKGAPAPAGKKGGLFGFLKRQPKGVKIIEERVVQGKADPREVSKDLGDYKKQEEDKKKNRASRPMQQASQQQTPKPPAPPKPEKKKEKKGDESWKAEETLGSDIEQDDIVVNLLPEGQLMPAEIKRRMQVVIISVVAAISVVALVGGITRWQIIVVKAKNKDLHSETAVLQNKLRVEKSRVEKNQDVITRLMALPIVFEERHVWTNFFARFEGLTLKNVYHDFMNANNSKVSTEVVAPNWKDASEQLSLWQDEAQWWDDLVVTNIRSENETVSETEERIIELLDKGVQKNVKYSLDVTLNKKAWEDLETQLLSERTRQSAPEEEEDEELTPTP